MIRSYKDIEEEIKGFYKDARKDWGFYRSYISQVSRFKSIMKFLPKELTLCEVGCGSADFPLFLEKNGFLIKEYVGIELLEDMYNLAVEKYAKGKFYLGSLRDLKIEDAFDWVVGIGFAEVVVNKKYVFGLLKKMFRICKEGIAVTFLFKPNKLIRDGEVVFHPMDVFSFMCKNITRRVIIDYSYAPHCYTALGFKGDSEWMLEWKRTGGW